MSSAVTYRKVGETRATGCHTGRSNAMIAAKFDTFCVATVSSPIKQLLGRVIGSNVYVDLYGLDFRCKVKGKFFSLPLLPKAKRSVGNKESGSDMLRPKIKLR